MSKRGADARFRRSNLSSLQDRANVAGYELLVHRDGARGWVYELRPLGDAPRPRFPLGGGSSLGITLIAAEMAVVELNPRR